jgi:hypothetical protein
MGGWGRLAEHETVGAASARVMLALTGVPGLQRAVSVDCKDR